MSNGTYISKGTPLEGKYIQWTSIGISGRNYAINPLWTFGYNNYGQLGTGNTTSYSSPVQVGSLTNWKLVAGGQYHTAAIKTDGTLWTFGFNNYGQLGQGNITSYSSPVQVGTLTNWSQVACGIYHTAAVY